MIDWNQIRAVVFDLDGTLIDSYEIWRAVDEAFFAQRGMPVPDGYQEEIAHLGFHESAAYTVRRYLPDEREEDIIQEWRALSLAQYASKDGAQYFKAGAIELVRCLYSAGLKLCVATASLPEFFLPILRAGGVQELFDACITVSEVGKSKGFPDIFLRSAQALGVAPSACVVFEDNRMALASARLAGMRTAAVYDRQEPAQWKEITRAADLAVQNFDEVLHDFCTVRRPNVENA